MRGLVLAIAVSCTAASAAAAEREPRAKRPKSSATRKAPAKKKQPEKKPPPATAAPTSAQRAGAINKESKDGGAPFRLSYAVGAGVGGFYAGGANRGPAVLAHLTLTPPDLADGRFALDVELGWRLATFAAQVEGLGALTSSAHAVPITPALRFRALQVNRLTLDLRAGAGLLVVVHHLSSDFGPPATRSGLGWEAFAGAQARVPLSSFELFVDARYALGEAHVPFVLGRATGLQALIGARYAL